MKTNPSPTYQQAVAALDQLLKQEGLSEVEKAFREVVASDRETAYLSDKKPCAPTRHICWNRLQGKECPEELHSLPAVDHPQEFIKDGHRIATSQVHGLSFDQLVDIVDTCKTHHLVVEINAWTSWKFPGRTLLLEYRAKE